MPIDFDAVRELASVLVRLSHTGEELLGELAELLDAAWARTATPKIVRDAGRAP